MKAIRKIYCTLFLLISGAGAYQGRRQFEKVVSIAQRALKIDPTSYMALLYLGDDLIRLKRYQEAKMTLEEAISIYPENYQFHEMMVTLLHQIDAPVEQTVSHIKQYFKNKPSTKHEFPSWVKLVFKLFKPNFDPDAYSQHLDSYKTSWERWAEKIPIQHNKENEPGSAPASVTRH